jgi:hypothetical protein
MAPSAPRPGDDIIAAIACEISKVMKRLDADPELLAVIGSWCDTLDHEEILIHLREFNTRGQVLHRAY